MTQESFFSPIVDQLQLLLTTASSDWRYWFAHVVTWLLIAKMKLWWDHMPESRADRLTETIATLTCALFSLWVFAGHEHIYKISLANGLLNTYLYKLATLVLDRVGLNFLADKLKGSGYKVSTRPVEQDAAEVGVDPTSETMFLFRKGDGKTIAVKRGELHKYKVTQK